MPVSRRWRSATAQPVAVKPVDYGVIFPQSGGLPLAKRAPQRQAYRLVELARWRDHLGVPLNIHPKFFPADPAQAACLICAAPEAKRLAVAGDCLRAVWAEEKNIADAGVIAEIAARHGIADAAAASRARKGGLRKQHPGGRGKAGVRRADLCLQGRTFLGPGPARFS